MPPYTSELLESKEYTVPFNQSISVADELSKLAKLKEEGILTEKEFLLIASIYSYFCGYYFTIFFYW